MTTVFSIDGIVKELAALLSPNMLAGLAQLRGLSTYTRDSVDHIYKTLDELAFDDLTLTSGFGAAGGSERDKLAMERQAVEANGRVSEAMVAFLLPRITRSRIKILQLEGWMSARALDSLLPQLSKIRAFFFEPGPTLYPPAQLAALLRRSATTLTTLSLCYSWSHWARATGGAAAAAAPPSGQVAAAGLSLDTLSSALSELESAEQQQQQQLSSSSSSSSPAAGGAAAPARAPVLDAAGEAAAIAAAGGKLTASQKRLLKSAKIRAEVAAAAAAEDAAAGGGSGGAARAPRSIFEESPEERDARLEATRAALAESRRAHGELAAAIAQCSALRVLELTLPMPWPDSVPLCETLPRAAPLRVLDLFLRRANLAPEVTALVHHYGAGLRELSVTCHIANEGQVTCHELACALLTARRLRHLRLSGFALDMTTVLPHMPLLEELVGTSDGMQGNELALFVCPRLKRAHLVERRACSPDPLGGHIMACAAEAMAAATEVAERAARLAAEAAAAAAAAARALEWPSPSPAPPRHCAPVTLDLAPRPAQQRSAALLPVDNNNGDDEGRGAAGAGAMPPPPAAASAAAAPPPLRLPTSICGRLQDLTLVFQHYHAAYEARAAAGQGPAALRAAADAVRRAAEEVPGCTSKGSLRRALFAALPHLTRLQRLDLRRGSNYGPLLAALGDSPAAATLTQLTIQHVGDLAPGDVASLLARCPALTRVEILHSELGKGGQAALLAAVHAALVARAKLAAWAPGAAARQGPHFGVRISFGAAVCQLDETLARAWQSRDPLVIAAPQPAGAAAAALRAAAAGAVPPHPLCLLEPPTGAG